MFSKSCKYAMRAVLYLATKTDESNKIGAIEISAELEVPMHFLAKILQQLSRNRLISSSKGRNGGFYLSNDNKSATLLAVIESFEGPGTFTDCVLGLRECSNVNPCPYHNSVQKYRNSFFLQLQNETIAETAKRINEHNFNLKNN
jgi:Rrf2 family protein